MSGDSISSSQHFRARHSKLNQHLSIFNLSLFEIGHCPYFSTLIKRLSYISLWPSLNLLRPASAFYEVNIECAPPYLLSMVGKM